MPRGLTSNALRDCGAGGRLDVTGPRGAPVLRHVSLTVPARREHVVLGPMHSGKSLVAPSRPRARTSGARQGHHRRRRRSTPPERTRISFATLRRRVGVVFDSSALVSRLTLLENVELPLVEHTPVGAERAREMAAGLLHDVGMVGDHRTYP